MTFPIFSGPNTEMTYSFEVFEDVILEDTEEIPIRATVVYGEGIIMNNESTINILDNEGKYNTYVATIKYGVTIMRCEGSY